MLESVIEKLFTDAFLTVQARVRTQHEENSSGLAIRGHKKDGVADYRQSLSLSFATVSLYSRT